MAKADTALLKSTNGCMISTVDGQSVMAPGVTLAGLIGGNEVRVVPGIHSVQATMENQTTKWTYGFRFPCEKGHIYIIKPANMLGGNVAVFDSTLGRPVSAIIDDKVTAALAGEPAAAPAPGATTPPVAPTVTPPAAAIAPTGAVAPTGVVAPAATVALTGAVMPTETSEPAQVAPLGVTKIHGLHVLNSTKDGIAGVKATATILLKDVENVTFELEAVITDAKGVPLQVGNSTLRASRSVMTGDDEDEDDYSVFVPCQGLYTMANAPALVYVQLRLTDGTGKIRAASQLKPFGVNVR